MATTDEIICVNRECRVAEVGKCVEGFELSACPHYGREPDDPDDESEPDDDISGLQLPGADTLTLEGASRVLRARDARVIAIIGPKGAGKTSLIASVYDLFQEGPVGGTDYARSETLHAFELACHDARAASRRGAPDMERTPLGEVRFYHLELAGGPAGDVLALLLGDRAGEEYRSASDDVTDLPAFPEVSRADTLTVLVDGERLLDAGARHNLRSEILMMLQALLDGGALRSGQQLILVLTKLDAVQTSPHRERAQNDFTTLDAQVRRAFDTTFNAISACTIAASPSTGGVARGTGVAAVLALWAEPAATPPTSPSPGAPAPARAFARLTALPGAEEADG